MIHTELFGKLLRYLGYTFYSGVPCSFLKDLINVAMNDCHYIAAANEGDAVAICAGAALGGKKTVVLMQNSGLGNAVSPLTSLNYCFKLPTLGFVSLRGEPALKDEPQHELMGTITETLLETMQIKWDYLAQDFPKATEQVKQADSYMQTTQLPFFFVVRKGTFSKVTLKDTTKIDFEYPTREACLEAIIQQKTPQTLLLATTGKTGRELFELNDDKQNFYQVGSMGCISSIGLGLAKTKPDFDIILIDGDGAALMRMGNLPTLGHYKPKNILHILLDNGVHDSTGGQKTVSDTLDFPTIAKGSGYETSINCQSIKELSEAISQWKSNQSLTFVAIKIKPGSKESLGRPTQTPEQVKNRLMEYLND